jgi:hypothetical protein
MVRQGCLYIDQSKVNGNADFLYVYYAHWFAVGRTKYSHAVGFTNILYSLIGISIDRVVVSLEWIQSKIHVICFYPVHSGIKFVLVEKTNKLKN